MSTTRLTTGQQGSLGDAPTTPQSISEIYIQASEQHHLARCARCRDLGAAVDAAATANAESMARRDRIQLGLGRAHATTAVNAR